LDSFSRFFIDRPIFAAVLSIMIFVAGAIAIPLLPISEYPDVVPPTVVVQATYPGANPKVIAETVSSPLEEQINGVENMMYMKSVAGSDGVLQMTITFAPGTDPNKAQVDVQNRVSQALSRLPSEVVSLGVTTQKQSPAFLTLITLISDGTYDPLYLRNYANIRVKDQLARIPGVGQIRLFGGGDYAMRVWLDPDKIASRGMTAGDVVRAIQEQNIQVSAGQLGAEPIKGGSDFLIAINAQGRLRTAEEFGDVVLKTGSNGEVVRLSDVARIELGASDYTLRGQLDRYNTSIIGVFQAPGANALATRDAVIAKMDELARQFPPGVSYRSDYDATVFVRESVAAVIHTLFEAIALVVLVVILFLQTWRASIIPLIAVPVSVVGTFAVLYLLGFSINTLSLFGLVLAIGIVVDDAIVVVENVERNIEEGRTPLEAAHQAMTEVSGPIVAIALVLCAVFVPMAFLTGVTGTFYKQFAGDHRDLDRDLGDQFADLVASARRQIAAFARRAEGYAFAPHRTPARLVLPTVQPLLQGELGRLRGRRFAHARTTRRGIHGLCRPAGWHRGDVQCRAAWLHSDPGQALSDRRREVARGFLTGALRCRAAKDEGHRARHGRCRPRDRAHRF